MHYGGHLAAYFFGDVKMKDMSAIEELESVMGERIDELTGKFNDLAASALAQANQSKQQIQKGAAAVIASSKGGGGGGDQGCNKNTSRSFFKNSFQRL